MQAGVAQGGLISLIIFSLCVNGLPIPSYHVYLALYADEMAVIATSRKPTLLVSYLECYLSNSERWLREWRITINVSNSTTMLFTRLVHPEASSSSAFWGANVVSR